jgi:hypothetical protein
MKIKMKIKLSKKSTALLIVFALCTLVFFVPKPVAAGWVATVVGGLAQGIATVLGWILNALMGVLIQVAQYNSFIKSAAIVNGWVIARDVANMFFVIILLIIAFATILRIENYSYKKWLPKLILMAILINFSKTICGLLIDLSQVVMLTFVNAFKDVAAGSLVDMLGITGWQSLDGIENVGEWTVASAYVLSVIYIIITLTTVAAMVGMLVMRIVMIWVYVVLSPFAYLLAAFPGGAKYSSQWWSEFTKNLIVGPVLAFFIWLSFASLVSFNNTTNDVVGTFKGENDITCQANPDGICKYGTSDLMIKFIVAIAMLLGGMKIAQEIGGAAAGVAGKISSKGNALALGGAAAIGAKGVSWAGKNLGDGRDWVSERVGVDLNVAAGYKRYRQQVEDNRALRKTRVYDSALKGAEEGKTWMGRKAALFSTGDVAWQNIADGKFFRGSPHVRDNTTKEIKAKEDEKRTVKDEISNIESQKIITNTERRQMTQEVIGLDQNMSRLSKEKDDITSDRRYKYLESKSKSNTLTAGEATEFAQKTTDLDKINAEHSKSKERKEELQSDIKKSVIVKNEAGRAKQKAENADLISQKVKQTESIDEDIKKLTVVLQKNKLSEIQTSKASVNAKIEGEASKKLSNINNSDQLVSIFHEAMEAKDKGLMMATYKKLAKQGNYNDLHRDLGLGTGYEGMIGMAKKLEEEGGMSQQDARGTVADVGEICKSVKHYEAFGSMYMDQAGQWQKTSVDDQEAAIFSEKAKIQVQAYVRDGNRLANGSYQSGKPHNAQNWELSRSTIKLFASKDAQYAEDMKKTGNVNSIMFIAANAKNLEVLRKNGASLTAAVIEEIASKAKNSDVSNPLKAIQSVVK